MNRKTRTNDCVLVQGIFTFWCCALFAFTGHAGNIRGGQFAESGYDGPADGIAKLRADAWTCPETNNWPKGWSGHGSGVTLERFPLGGRLGDPFCRMSGPAGYLLCDTPVEVTNRTSLLTFWVKGGGVIQVGYQAYGLGEDGKTLLPLTAPGDVPQPFVAKVESPFWVRYQSIMEKPSKLRQIRLTVTVLEGEVDFDDFAVGPPSPARELMTREAEKLYNFHVLTEDKEMVMADNEFRSALAEYHAACDAMRAKAKSLDPKLVGSLEAEIAGLKGYVEGERTMLFAFKYNDMLLLTRVCNALAKPATKSD